MLTRLRVRSAPAASNGVRGRQPEERCAAPALHLHRHALLLHALERVDELLDGEPGVAPRHPVGALGEPVGGDLDQEDPVGRLAPR